jgi:hypothetical protein
MNDRSARVSRRYDTGDDRPGTGIGIGIGIGTTPPPPARAPALISMPASLAQLVTDDRATPNADPTSCAVSPRISARYAAACVSHEYFFATTPLLS